MFNYVVKDPNSSRLSGERWIKDQDAEAIYVSSNWMALRLDWATYRNISRTPRTSGNLKKTRSVAYDVEHELSKSIKPFDSCQHIV